MPGKKIGYTLEQHERLGLELQTMRDRLNKTFVDLQKNYRRDAKAIRKAGAALNAVDKLRSELDSLVCKEQAGNKDLECTKVYYRAHRSDYVKNPQPITPNPKDW